MILYRLFQRDAVDKNIEVRSRSAFALVEVAVADNFGLAGEGTVVLNVSKIGSKSLAFNGELGSIEYVEFAGNELCLQR